MTKNNIDQSEMIKKRYDKTIEKIKTSFPFIYGDDFDYSDLVNNYNGNDKIYTFICKKHGEFKTHGFRVMDGKRRNNIPCPGCRAEFVEERKEKKKLARKVKYQNSHEYKYDGYVKGQKVKVDQKEFLRRVRSIFGDLYDFSKAVYVNPDTTPIEASCQIHGPFTQTAKGFYRGYGCPKCAREKAVENTRKPFEYLLKELHATYGNRFKVKKDTYVSMSHPATFICPEHGEIIKSPAAFLVNACKKCSEEDRTLNFESFKRKATAIHRNKYEYSDEGYTTSSGKVKITCPLHGVFYQTGQDHLRGRGCLLCTESNEEREINSLLNEFGLLFDREVPVPDTRLRFDFVLKKKFVVIEYNGIHHYTDIFNNPDQLARKMNNDQYKLKYVIQNDGDILVIPFTLEFSKVKTLIKTFLYSLNLTEECFVDKTYHAIYINKLL